MPGCDPMTGMNIPSGLKERLHAMPTPQTPKAMTQDKQEPIFTHMVHCGKT